MTNSHLMNSSRDTKGSIDHQEIIPEAHPTPFINGIDHPNLYLWDVWSASTDGTTHLYCLAVSNKDERGNLLPPECRNQKSFHIRHFVSHDNGESWIDKGCFQQARHGQDIFDSKSIWSGSILPLSDGRKLMGYTGIRDRGNTLAFHQTLALSISDDWNVAKSGSQTLLSDPLIDYNCIREKGYFLGEADALGHKDGEANGPILAWRDPFLLCHEGQLHMFWSAKMESNLPALGHALLTETESGFAISELFQATAMPDGQQYTQLELPKVLYDDVQNRFMLLVSSCNRLHERQSDKEADKRMRLYTSASLEGPWCEFGHAGSTLSLAEPHMFGITIVEADFELQQLKYVAPFTEEAGIDKFLKLSKTHSLDMRELG